jgi:RNA polymerase primary sigma factor
MYFPAHVKDNFFQIQEQIAEHSCECCYDSADIVCPILVNELATVQKWDEIDSYNLVFYHKQWVYIEDIDEYDDILSDRGMLSELMFECAEASINAITISVAIQTLSEKEQLVIKLRYGFAEGRVCTLEEIGRLLCVTRERIRQIEVKALRKLQRYLSYHKYTI